MDDRSIFWLDEEENAAFPEITMLKFRKHQINYLSDVTIALEIVSHSGFDPSKFKAFVIDAHMPDFGDARFEGDTSIDRSLAGVRFCSILSKSYPEVWRTVSQRVLIYTTLPPSPRVEAVKSFAGNNNIMFAHKTSDGDIFDKLISFRWL